jgi:SAM-dependent methyltransferase
MEAQAGQAEIDQRNSSYWNTLCGTNLAQSLGITDFSQDSLMRFDEYYFGFYPYLSKHIPFGKMYRKRVLEAGLGYGTIAQAIALAGAEYFGLDIAAGPVEVVNRRFALHTLPGGARQESILNTPFPGEMFDYVVTIGCLHHTGNIPRGIAEVHRVLKPGGTAIVMLYNAYSYRRWFQFPEDTVKYFLWDYHGIGVPPGTSERERKLYDDSGNGAAPETAFTSERQLKKMAAMFTSVQVTMENAAVEPPFSIWQPTAHMERNELMDRFAATCGLDLYATLVK